MRQTGAMAELRDRWDHLRFEDPTPEQIDLVLAQLDGPVDIEHPDVSIVDESEWGLSAYPGGVLIWQNIEEPGTERHQRDVPRAEVRRLFLAVAAGDLATVHAQPWKPGYGTRGSA